MLAHSIKSEMFAFGVVGSIGFTVNTGVVYLMQRLIDPYAVGALAWLVAATTTWWLNRVWTFRHAAAASLLEQWLNYLSANLLGFVISFNIYALLVTANALCAREPVFAVGAGSVVSMLVNFILSRKMVFLKNKS